MIKIRDERLTVRNFTPILWEKTNTGDDFKLYLNAPGTLNSFNIRFKSFRDRRS